ncbi:MAG: SDR family NAD(P)-dependent oxidoreductase [Peptococcaceae bacterium]|nr:SDR family NAD(P)-dependent oxidoreductase [Peptococcaceae bacterium]
MVVIITGASSGIGLATAQALRERGHTVYGISRSIVPAADWEQFEADVTDVAALEHGVEAIFRRHGSIDSLVACAGIGLVSPSDAGGDLGAGRRLFDVNFFGVAEMVRLCLPRMKQAGRGSIMIISSMAGVFPLPYQAFYSASKAALCAYGLALTAEANPFGVQVTTFMPGGVRTPFTGKRQKFEDLFEDPRYPGYASAYLAISREEQTGMPAEQVVKAVVRVLKQKKPPVFQAVGGKYRLFRCLGRLVPDRAVAMVLRRKYTARKES